MAVISRWFKAEESRMIARRKGLLLDALEECDVSAIGSDHRRSCTEQD